MAINFGVFRRLDSSRFREERQEVLRAVDLGDFKKDTLYLFDDPELWQLAKTKNDKGRTGICP